MKLSLIPVAVVLVLVAAVSAQRPRSHLGDKETARDYAFNETCMNHLSSHIKRELQAAITYLTMGAWANHYTVQRPGLAKFFFESASEEREHGLAMLSYLRMRGHNDLDILPDVLEPINEKYEWDSPLSALRQALKMEKDVTDSIKKIIDYCADAEDHQLADYLTADFMEEQLNGQRKLAGHINTLRGLLTKQPQLADWIFDNKLNA
jgi:ferritin heavy chain